jgi:hypothetical protein
VNGGPGEHPLLGKIVSVIAPPGTSTWNRPSADVNVVSVYVETVVGRQAPTSSATARIAIARSGARAGHG